MSCRTARAARRAGRAPRWGIIVLAALVPAACDDAPTDTCNGDVDEIIWPDGGTLTFTRLQTGTVVGPRFDDGCGLSVPPPDKNVRWVSSDPTTVSVTPTRANDEPAAVIRPVSFGVATVTVEAEGAAADLRVEVIKPPTRAEGFTVLGSGGIRGITTALAGHGDYLYTGSRPWSCDESCEGWLYVWRTDGAGAVQRVDSVAVGTRAIDDLDVRADGGLAVVGRGRTGLALVDLADPAAPTVVSELTAGFELGIRNVEVAAVDGRDYAFVVAADADVTRGSHVSTSVRVVDITDPTAPAVVGKFADQDAEDDLQDVFVRDGLAFVAYGVAGLVIVDVGNGMAGGTPDAPVEVSRLADVPAPVNTAWYWPERSLVFVGEASPPLSDDPGASGRVRVADVSDMAAPAYVASFAVPGTPPRDLWLDEGRGVLFAGWADEGLRAVDVTGALDGDLAAQGRELGRLLPSGPLGGGVVTTPRVLDGVVFASDGLNGLWAARLDG